MSPAHRIYSQVIPEGGDKGGERIPRDIKTAEISVAVDFRIGEGNGSIHPDIELSVAVPKKFEGEGEIEWSSRAVIQRSRRRKSIVISILGNQGPDAGNINPIECRATVVA